MLFGITVTSDIEKARIRVRPGEIPNVHPTATIMKSFLGSWVEIGPFTVIEESEVLDYSYAFGDVMITYSEVGKFCSIASHARINPGNHPMDRVSQHHFTYRGIQYGFSATNDEAFFDLRRQKKCRIGHDVWIGHGATILPGVDVGIGAVVGAGSVVTKDVYPYEVVVGTPAHVVRKRFSEDVIEKLLTIGWWDWEWETLERHFDDFRDINSFLDRHG